MVFCTINDFLAYENLSGYSVQGHHACPVYEKETSYIQLKHAKKTIYTRLQRFLKHYHPYRQLKKAFNGNQEYESVPKPLAGNEVYDRLKDILTIFGKTQKKDACEKNIWKKRSIFFDLPCRSDLNVRHCIDVMHVEKNLCDSLIGPLLNIKGKTKYGHEVDYDLDILVTLVCKEQEFIRPVLSMMHEVAKLANVDRAALWFHLCASEDEFVRVREESKNEISNMAKEKTMISQKLSES